MVVEKSGGEEGGGGRGWKCKNYVDSSSSLASIPKLTPYP